MEENNKEVIEEVPISSEKEGETPKAKTLETPEVKTTETPEGESAETPAAVEKKETTRRKKQAAPETKAAVTGKNTPREEAPDEKEKKTTVPRLKASLRHGFQFKGHYYSRAELGRKIVLAGLWKKYPGLFEK